MSLRVFSAVFRAVCCMIAAGTLATYRPAAVATAAAPTDDLVGYELLRKPFTVSALASSVAAALSKRPNEPIRSSGVAAKG